MHHQYSSSDSPFQANTGTPAAAMAAAAWSWVEKMLQLAQRTSAPRSHQRLNQHGGLDGHVQRAGDAHAGQRLCRRVFLADGHQAGHFMLGDGNFFAAPIGQAHVGDFVFGGGSVQRYCTHVNLVGIISRNLDMLMDKEMSLLKSLRLLGDPTRVRLLLLLEQEELSVAELQEILAKGQSQISTHLAQLKQAGLVEDRREGKNNFYRLRDEHRTGERTFSKLLALLQQSASGVPEASAGPGSAATGV